MKTKSTLYVVGSIFTLFIVLSCIKMRASWTEQQLAQLSLEEKIGQLLMVDMRPEIENEHSRLSLYFGVDVLADNKADYQKQVLAFITNHHIGGVIFMKGNPTAQVNLINLFQSEAKLPLLITQDAEWGPAMRVDGIIKFPFNMTLGALPESENHLIEKMGRIIGTQLRMLGVHVNFAPVVDVNNNPKNQIINHRSFGSSKENVAKKGYALLKGLESAGIIGCAKHFPGHGNVSSDSHLDLPILNQTLEELEEIELYPFKYLIDRGLSALMTAHLYVPHLDQEKNVPSTLSHATLTTLLKTKLGFSGLVFSDCMMMKSITHHFSPGEAAIRALQAGNNVIVMSPSIPEVFNVLKKKAEEDNVFATLIDTRLRPILETKERLGLTCKAPSIALPNLENINSDEAYNLKQELFNRAITLINNDQALVPLKEKSATLVCVGTLTTPPSLHQTLASYTMNEYMLPWNHTEQERSQLLENITSEIVVVTLHAMSQKPQDNFGITPAFTSFLEKLKENNKKVILVIFGNPYSIGMLPQSTTMIVGYEDEKEAHQAAAAVLCGHLKSSGILPITPATQEI